MDEHFRKMADQWRSNVTTPLSPATSHQKPGRVMKVIPPAISIPAPAPTSPECPELLSSGSEKEKVYSSDSGTFDSDEDGPQPPSSIPDDEENQTDYFYLSPRLDAKDKNESGGGKRVTFSKNLVKV